MTSALARGARPSPRSRSTLTRADRCRRKFLHYFPAGFRDVNYLAWERGYKWNAHQRWVASLGPARMRALIRAGREAELATAAISIESRTNLLFSFEKMALRDAVRTASGAATFARGLYQYLHGRGSMQRRFEAWCEAVRALPRRQTRVLTWPLLTVFGFIGRPDMHIFLKPRVTQAAAVAYGFEFCYESKPDWDTYVSLMAFAERVRQDLSDLKPRDMIDLQSFIWVQGSAEYP